MKSDITRRIDEVRADHVHGAGWLARRAVLTLGQAVSDSTAPDRVGLEHELRTVVAALVAAKPSMAPVANLVCRLGYEILERCASEVPLGAVTRAALRRARELAHEAEAAVQIVPQQALSVVDPGAVILTCSYSSAILATLAHVERSGRGPSVLIARSWDGAAAHGERLAHQLSALGLGSTVVPDSSLQEAAHRASLAMIGADAVLPDASVINGHPSRALAQAVRGAGTPLYCVCETLKLDPRPLLDQEPRVEAGFELIPASFVDGFITELGLLAPRQVVDLVPQRALYLAPFFGAGTRLP